MRIFCIDKRPLGLSIVLVVEKENFVFEPVELEYIDHLWEADLRPVDLFELLFGEGLILDHVEEELVFLRVV